MPQALERIGCARAFDRQPRRSIAHTRGGPFEEPASDRRAQKAVLLRANVPPGEEGATIAELMTRIYSGTERQREAAHLDGRANKACWDPRPRVTTRSRRSTTIAQRRRAAAPRPTPRASA